ncbi:DNA phosphorothioation-dependent restriction protein DptH [Bacterioplanoides sp. SCSIO 12839]|uniref:DNA phosphorothioation-dependent restriction protein DptH n=1 Tax=Bacterioplanoides sp. SCSIO 12839 TaxID=2829569 RepID=UPI0021072CCA|nr:DNA phosphorothioation-dependent restriction protein DptH [Bacterioplanoides sp. SCSIO 12839]UTW49822.1 DNA phosphorothioation-dependent restriction protein DptH [Bacterioplanoides sp. SCSIO 12839]
MSEKQFEGFLVRHLKDWLTSRLKPGDRFQFRSTDPDNTVRLLSALHDSADGTVDDEGTSLSYLDVNDIQLLIAGHAEEKSVEQGCYTDNYLAKLRDRVVDDRRALIMVHNSSLDTITNSTFDLAHTGAIWSVAKIRDLLEGLIDESMTNRDTSKCLLDLQTKIVASDGASIFGYRSLYESMIDGDLRFDELGLFNDPHLTDSWGGATTSPNQRQIERRLEENRKLRSDIEFEIEHHPAEIEDRLTQFGGKFVKDNFVNSDEWKNRTYDEFVSEIQKQKKQALELVDVVAATGNLQRRSKKETAAGQREQNVLLQVPEDQSTFQIDLKFTGARTEKSEFEIQPKKAVKLLELSHKPRGNNTTFTISGAMTQEPLFFSVRTRRELSSEQFKFQCLVLPEGRFCFDDIVNKYLIKATGRGQTLVIQSDVQLLVTNPELESSVTLNDNDEVIDVDEVGTLDYRQIYDESDEVRFILKSGATELPVHVEGESAKESLTLPLLMDTSRARHMFNDDYYGVYKESKGTVVVENQEVMQLFLRKQLLDAEWEFIASELVCWDASKEKGLPAVGLTAFPELQSLHQSYLAFLAHFKSGNRRTLPSLEGWGPELVQRAKTYVSEYLSYLETVERGKTLSPATKLVMKLGTANIRDAEENRVKSYLTPFHPLILAYYLYLIENILADGDDLSFRTLPEVTLKRLTARGLIPHLFDDKQQYSYTQTVDENAFWLEIVPREDSSFDYIGKLVKRKIEEFTETFSRLFDTVSSAPVLINSVNNAENRELFRGLLAYYIEHLEEGRYIHVNLYDDDEIETEFDLFAEMATYDDIKDRYDLDKGKAKRNTDTIVDVLRTRLTFSKFLNRKIEQQAYAHLTFFKNNQVVDARDNNIDEHLSGVACGGLLNGESSRSENDAYFTAFGLKGVDYSDKAHLKIARLFGAMWRPSKLNNDSYHEHSAISLAVSDSVKKLLDKSYDSSVWVTIVDPKVTLDFFSKSDDVILIHYSDQYTSSAGYDAITVTKQSQLYRSVLGASGESLIREFNAFNGEWLLQMVNDPQKEKLGKEGVIASYKAVSAMLSKSDICWVPLSVAEMIRVAGNIGLAMSDSDFSRHNLGIKQGAISDDVLFAGFKDGKLYLLPVESKAGARPNFDKARNQARELKEYMENLLGQENLAGRLYRGLFVRQVLMQVEKYQLYKVFSDDYFEALLSAREEWLEGNYGLAHLKNYPAGMVVAHLNTESCIAERYEEVEDILEIDIPMTKLAGLVHQPYEALKNELQVGRLLAVPDQYILGEAFASECGSQLHAGDDDAQSSEVDLSTPCPESVIECSEAAESELKRDASESFASPAPTGPLVIKFGTDVSNNQDVLWEPTNTEKLFNTNTGIIGTMGTGKTQFTKSVITQLVRNQHNNVGGTPIGILIFDYKADYVKDDFVEATGAKVYDLFHLPFNPLAIFGDRPMQPMHTANLFKTTAAKAFNLGTKQQNKIRTLVMAAYEAAGIYPQDKSTWGRLPPTLADVWAEFQAQDKIEQDSLYAALDDLISFEIFEPDSSKTKSLYDLVDGVTVINLSGYDPSIQNLVVALMLDLFYTQMHQQGSSKLDGDFRQISKMILVDEADNFMSQDFESLKKILKEGREFGVGTILSTQELTHFKTGDNDYSTLILSWVIHQVANIKPQEIKAIFNTQKKDDEEYFMGQIRKLEKHHSLCVDGKKKVAKIKDLAFWELK